MATLNPNYRIGTDTLPNGKIRATARGTKSNRATFDAAKHDHFSAASKLVEKINKAPVAFVEQVSQNDDGTRRDFEVWEV